MSLIRHSMIKHASKKQEINLNPKKTHAGKFPRISRAITESILSFVRDEKNVLLASLSGVFFFCLMLYMTVQLSVSLRLQKTVEMERGKVAAERAFWEAVTKERPGFRDGYFMLALLEYRLGKEQEAKQNVSKALEIDPNFQKGREFEKILKSN